MESIRELDAELRRLLDAQAEPTWVFDVEREGMVYGSGPACDFWRAKDARELRLRDFSSDMSNSTRSRLARVLSVLEGNAPVHEQWTFYPAAGSPRTVLLRADPVGLRDARFAILFSGVRAAPQRKGCSEVWRRCVMQWC